MFSPILNNDEEHELKSQVQILLINNFNIKQPLTLSPIEPITNPPTGRITNARVMVQTVAMMKQMITSCII